MKRTVLVVDDNEADQALARLALTRCREDVTLLQAYDGVEALAVLDRLGAAPGPLLILLDINMPRMDGFATLAAIQERPLPRPVVVMLSTSSREADRAEALARGAAEYCVKADSMHAMTEMMRRLIRTHLGEAEHPLLIRKRSP